MKKIKQRLVGTYQLGTKGKVTRLTVAYNGKKLKRGRDYMLTKNNEIILV